MKTQSNPNDRKKESSCDTAIVNFKTLDFVVAALATDN